MKTIGFPFRNFTTSFSAFILCTVVFAQNLLPGELLPPLVVMITSLILMATGRLKTGYLRFVWPLFAVLFLGIIGLKGHETFDILRDIAYALTPIALIFIGYWMAGNKEMWPIILKVMVACGFVLAVIHMAAFVRNPQLLGADLVTVRKEAGSTGGLVVLSLVLGVFQSRLGVGNLFPRFLPRIVALPVLLASFILSYSRTDFVLALIFALALGGVLSRFRFRSILIISLIAIGFIVMVVTAPEGDNKTFRGKLARSVTEVAIEDFADLSDIHANWRGFETYRVVDTFLSGSTIQKIFGQGAGALVDIGFPMKLEGEEFRFIPVFHNGYAYVLLKTGLLGIGCYIIFYLGAIRSAVSNSNSDSGELKFLSKLLLGCVLSLSVTMFVVGGMAEIHDAEIILLTGYLVGRAMQGKTGRARTRVKRRKKAAGEKSCEVCPA